MVRVEIQWTDKEGQGGEPVHLEASTYEEVERAIFAWAAAEDPEIFDVDYI